MRSPGVTMKTALLLVGLGMALAVVACSSQPREATSLEQQAYALNKAIMCPICPGESIDQSQVELARQMRQVVLDQLAEGRSDEQIKGFFVQRYGPSVLMAPPQEGFHLLAWVVPPMAVAAAVVALALILWRLRRRGASLVAGPAETVPAQEQQAYLQRAEALLEAEAPSGGGDNDQRKAR
ncbi:MAG: cytochrome c-type biogenesis protein CcmH [Dehalococcoidia bacterium]|nr:cytochrome c-type biogenesis protein CcmH [Dehalococcoidia bacterium]